MQEIGEIEVVGVLDALRAMGRHGVPIGRGKAAIGYGRLVISYFRYLYIT